MKVFPKGLGWTLSPLLAVISLADASADSSKNPQVQRLPPLREQAKIVDAWTEERKSLVPSILRKYNVDAWLVGLIAPALLVI